MTYIQHSKTVQNILVKNIKNTSKYKLYFFSDKYIKKGEYYAALKKR